MGGASKSISGSRCMLTQSPDLQLDDRIRHLLTPAF